MIIFASTEETSLSIFHYSETTFLNLKRFSNPCSLEYRFKTFSHKDYEISDESIELISKVLNCSRTLKLHGYGIIFQNTNLGDVILQPGILKIPFFKAPNGNREYQGWILSEKDYYTKEQEDGDLPKIEQLINTFESLGISQKSLSVNVQVSNSSSLLRDLMVNYYRKENRKHALNENNFERQERYSKIFLKILLDVENGQLTYNPSMDRLFDDYIIRQTVEIVANTTSVWSQDIKIVRGMLFELLRKSSFEYPKYGFDITPILLEYKKDDEISKRLSHLIQSSNSVQFNEFHGKVEKAIKRAVGFVKVTELYGPIVADSAVSQISYIEIPMIKKIRERLLNNRPIYIKYIVWDAETCPQIYKEKHQMDTEFYKEQDIILGHIATNVYGISPLIIPEAVVWHQRTEHRFNLLGKYNPSLINYNLLHLLENKYLESLFWNEYCPKFLPKTVLLYHLLPNGTDPNDVSPELFVELANKEFPNGWIIKGVWDYNGILHVTTHLSNFTNLINEYRKSKFDSIVSKYKENLPGCEPIEDLNTYLKDEKHFKGWKNNQYLKDSTSCTIQEFKKPKREYRIECFGGECPLESMSNDFFFSHLDSNEAEANYRTSLHDFFMKCIKSLPPSLQHIPLTSDLAETDNKRKIVYETNPGGNSWLLHHSYSVAEVHNHYLKLYPQAHELTKLDQPLKNGISSSDQIKYIKELLKKWKVDLSVISKRFKILKDRITDTEHVVPYSINLSRMNYTGPSFKPPRIVNENQKYFSLTRVLHLLQNNQTLMTSEGMNLLEIFIPFYMMKNDLKKSHRNFIKEYLGKIQENVKKIFEKDMKDINIYENYKEFSKHQFSKISSLVLPKMKILHLFKMFNITYPEFEALNLKLFEKIISNEKYKYLLFDGFKIFEYQKIDQFLLELDDLGKEEETLNEINQFLYKLSSILEIVYHIERLGMKIPGISLQTLLNNWVPKVRKIYDEFFRDESTYQKYNALWNTLISVSNFITKLLQLLSDHSLFKLDKQFYVPSLDFLRKSIILIQDQNSNPKIIGQILNVLSLFQEDNLMKYQFYLVYKQSKFGFWKNKESSLLETTKECVKGLINFKHATPKENEEFLSLVSLETYQKKMKENGFFISL